MCVRMCYSLVDSSLEDVAKFKYFGTTATYPNYIHEGIKGRLNSGTRATIQLVILSSYLLSNNLKIKIYKV